MMRSLFSGVSGLKNHQTRMDVIGNNISNVNTTGFKSSRVTFTDTLNQTLSAASSPTENLGGTNPKQIGLGSSVASIDMLFTDGSVQSTGKNTDLCLSGNALFVVSNGTQTYYTRDGAFEFDSNGSYVLPGSGLYVQGWMADNGKINPDPGGIGNITIEAGKSMESQETEIVTYHNNLNAATKGYTVQNIIVSQTDGTTTTVSSYNPSDYAGAIKLTCDDGVYQVPRNAEYKVGTAATFSIGTVDSISVNAAGQAQLDVDIPGKYASVTMTGTTIPAAAVGVGTYSIGGTYSVTKKITEVIHDAADNDHIKLKFDAGDDTITEVEVPKPNEGTYAVGDSFTIGLKITGGKTIANDGAGATVSASNTGNSVTLTTTDAADEFALGAAHNIKRTPTAISNVSPVKSVTITTTDGTTLTGLTNKSYAANSTFYPSSTTAVTIYDSLGAQHSVPVLFTKTSDNTWELSLAEGATTTTIEEPDGTTTTVSLTSNDLKFSQSGQYISGTASLSLSYTNGASDRTVSLNLGSLTQYASDNTIYASGDGHSAGTLESISIDNSGVIIGTYTNSVRQAEAQVAVAQFHNAAGLTKTGDSLYQVSNNSGEANVQTVNALGVKVTASALEMSNVDIANEFADMIITQRGFQSNSKMITVGDEMLETVINMKR